MLDPPSQAALIATGVRGSLAGGGVEGSAQQAESPGAEGEGWYIRMTGNALCLQQRHLWRRDCRDP